MENSSKPDHIARDREEMARQMDLYTLWELEFHRADCPPKTSETFLCTNGESVFTAVYSPEEKKWFRGPSIMAYEVEVRAWSQLPEANDCMADCYPDRACRVCGCTQDNGCLGGCSWVSWDLCSACKKDS